MSRTDRIPGIPSQSEVALLAIISRLEKRLDGLEKGPTSPPIITGDFQAKEGQYVRVAAPSGGLNLTLPEARASNRGSKITVSFETESPVYLRAVNGEVNRKPYVVNTLVGTFDAVSDGENGWSVALGASDSGSGLDAEFFTGAAHSSISNERVARDSLSVRVDRTTPGFVEWDAPWSGVLAEGPQSGANNPVINAGQWLQFGTDPPNGTGQIRSHEVGGIHITPDATLGLSGGSTVEIAAGSNVTIDAANTIDIDAVAGTTLTGGGLAVDVTFQVDLKAGSFVSVDPFLKFVTEHAASTPSMSAGQALLWIKDNTPNTPKYTDDTNADFDIPLGVSSTSLSWDATTRTFQRPALTGAIAAPLNSNATVFGTGAAGASLTGDGTATLTYTGAQSNINVTPTSGSQGVVDISTLKCGGIITYQSVTEATIDGFTVPPNDGWWIIVHNRDATTGAVIKILENQGNTTTSVRTPDTRDIRLYKNDSVMLYYSNSRWRSVASMPWISFLGQDNASWTAQEDNHARTSSGQNCIRVTMTGNQTLTGLVADASSGGTANGQLVLVQNIDSADVLTLANDSSSSTAANRFFLPGAADIKVGFRESALVWYDDTSGRWRYIGHSPHGRLLAISVYAASGTHTYDKLCKTAVVTVIGGGGGTPNVTASASNINVSSGGGAGKITKAQGTPATATATVTIGAGGAAGSAGSSSTFSDGSGNNVAAGSGQAGTASGSNTTGLTVQGGGASSSATAVTGLWTQIFASFNPGQGGPAIRLSGTVALSGSGGSSPLTGGQSPHLTSAGAATAGSPPGGGASGALSDSTTTRNGAAGADGMIIVEEYS